jgi:hypothetical protein
MFSNDARIHVTFVCFVEVKIRYFGKSLALKNWIKWPILPTPWTSILYLFIGSNFQDLVMFLRKNGKIVKIDEKWKQQYFCQKFEITNLEKNKNPSEFVFENNYDNFNFKPINSSNIWFF